MTATTSTSKAITERVFQLDYSLKHNEVTEHTTSLGYFHGMRLLVLAENEMEAVSKLTVWHDDGKPEAIKATDLGTCLVVIERA